MSGQNKLCMKMCQKDHKTQKKCVKIRFKEVIFYSIAFKSQDFAQVEYFAHTCVCVSATFRNSDNIMTPTILDTIKQVSHGHESVMT